MKLGSQSEWYWQIAQTTGACIKEPVNLLLYPSVTITRVQAFNITFCTPFPNAWDSEKKRLGFHACRMVYCIPYLGLRPYVPQRAKRLKWSKSNQLEKNLTQNELIRQSCQDKEDDINGAIAQVWMTVRKWFLPIRGTEAAAFGVDSASRSSKTKNARKMFIPWTRKPFVHIQAQRQKRVVLQQHAHLIERHFIFIFSCWFLTRVIHFNVTSLLLNQWMRDAHLSVKERGSNVYVCGSNQYECFFY